MYLSRRDKQLLKTLANPSFCKPNEYVSQDFVCQWSVRRKQKVNYASDAVAFRRLADLGLVSQETVDGELRVRIEESGRNRAAALRREILLKLLSYLVDFAVGVATGVLIEYVANHLH